MTHREYLEKRTAFEKTFPQRRLTVESISRLIGQHLENDLEVSVDTFNNYIKEQTEDLESFNGYVENEVDHFSMIREEFNLLYVFESDARERDGIKKKVDRVFFDVKYEFNKLKKITEGIKTGFCSEKQEVLEPTLKNYIKFMQKVMDYENQRRKLASVMVNHAEPLKIKMGNMIVKYDPEFGQLEEE